MINGAQFIAGGILIALPGQLLSAWSQTHSVRQALLVLPLLMLLVLPAFPFLFRVQGQAPARTLMEPD